MYEKHVSDARPGYDDRLIAAPASPVPTYPPSRFRFTRKTKPLPKHFHMPDFDVVQQQNSETAQDAGNAMQEDDLMDRLEPHGTYWELRDVVNRNEETEETAPLPVPEARDLFESIAPPPAGLSPSDLPDRGESTRVMRCHLRNRGREVRCHRHPRLKRTARVWQVGQARSFEVNWHELTHEERNQLAEAIRKEWNTWTEYNAWRIPDDAEAKDITSGELYPKKSRRLDLLLKDASRRNRPGWTLEFWDAVSAYLQSSGRKIALRLPDSPPPPGRNSREVVIGLRAIYGLRDSAKFWFHHLKSELHAKGWEESVIEPGVFFLRACAAGVSTTHKGVTSSLLVAVAFAYVDDLAVSYSCVFPSVRDAVHSAMAAIRAKKSSPDSLGYKFLGRFVQITDSGLRISHTIKVTATASHRAADAVLNDEELTAYRGMLGSLLWSGRTAVPELLVDISAYAQKVSSATVSDLSGLAEIAEAHCGASRELFVPRVVGESIADRTATFYTMADASFADGVGLKSQCGVVIMVGPSGQAERIAQNDFTRVGVVSWNSTTIKRVVRSTLGPKLGAEAYANAEGLEQSLLLRALLQEAWFAKLASEASMCTIGNTTALVQMYTDSHGLYDTVRRPMEQSTSRDKRLAISLRSLQQLYHTRTEGVVLNWTSTERMVADRLTKSSVASGALHAACQARRHECRAHAEWDAPDAIEALGP
eukprot:2109199-Amphidinium_carterae.1